MIWAIIGIAAFIFATWILGSYIAGRTNDHELTMARTQKQREQNGVKR